MIHTSMQKHAGILFISRKSSKILMILKDEKWTVPFFSRNTSVFDDSKELINSYYGKEYKLIPIELYTSHDQGFEFGTFICLVEQEFVLKTDETFCWANLDNLPKNVHNGLKSTLNDKIVKTKIDTILLMGKAYDQS